MDKRFSIIGIYLLLIFLILVLMAITLRSLLNSYHMGKTSEGITKIELQEKINFLNKQLELPEDKLSIDVLKKYDQKYGENALRGLQSARMASSMSIQEMMRTILQEAKKEATQQLQNIESKNFFSYIPEWPILLIAALGIALTRVITSLVDFAMSFIYSYFGHFKK